MSLVLSPLRPAGLTIADRSWAGTWTAISKLTVFYTVREFSLTLDVPDSDFTVAYGINDIGQIVGYSSGNHGFVYLKGRFRTLDAPGALGTNPFGINNRGQVIGWYMDQPTDPEEPSLTCGFLAKPSLKRRKENQQQDLGLCDGHTILPDLLTN
jgi:hypothetical protein